MHSGAISGLNLGIFYNTGWPQKKETQYKSSEIQSAITYSKINIFQHLKYQKNHTDNANIFDILNIEEILILK